ncbi:MAG: transposase [Spirochaetales bacterium]|nr:transposase [Spirochaetales bacterium]
MKNRTTNNSYPEEFKRNAVAVINSGIRLTDVARRLGIPKSTLFAWSRSQTYGNVGTASAEILRSLPATEGSADYRVCTFVKVPEDRSAAAGKGVDIESPVRISIGKVGLCFDRGVGFGEFRSIVDEFGGGDVL